MHAIPDCKCKVTKSNYARHKLKCQYYARNAIEFWKNVVNEDLIQNCSHLEEIESLKKENHDLKRRIEILENKLKEVHKSLGCETALSGNNLNLKEPWKELINVHQDVIPQYVTEWRLYENFCLKSLSNPYSTQSLNDYLNHRRKMKILGASVRETLKESYVSLIYRRLKSMIKSIYPNMRLAKFSAKEVNIKKPKFEIDFEEIERKIELGPEKIIIRVAQKYGNRVEFFANAKWEDYKSGVIHSTERKNNRTFKRRVDPESKKWLDEQKRHGTYIFYPTILEKRNIYIAGKIRRILIKHIGKERVRGFQIGLHCVRKQFAEALFAKYNTAKRSLKKVGDKLGHRDKNSTKYYLDFYQKSLY